MLTIWTFKRWKAVSMSSISMCQFSDGWIPRTLSITAFTQSHATSSMYLDVNFDFWKKKLSALCSQWRLTAPLIYPFDQVAVAVREVSRRFTNGPWTVHGRFSKVPESSSAIQIRSDFPENSRMFQKILWA